MKAVALIVVAALLSVASAQQYCAGRNVTWHPGVQPKSLIGDTLSLSQACPYGSFRIGSDGRCITHRQALNNYMGAPCHLDSDCGSSTYGKLACGEKKRCTWSQTRVLDDSCEDSKNCMQHPALNGTMVKLGCDASSNKCKPMVHVLVGNRARCNYTSGNLEYKCNVDHTCVYFDDFEDADATTRASWGAGICVPLLPLDARCDIKNKYDVYCGNGLTCLPVVGSTPFISTCQTKRKNTERCFDFAGEYSCDQTTTAGRLYCNPATTPNPTCTTYAAAGASCNGNYDPSASNTGNQCASGLRCLPNPTAAGRICMAPATLDQDCVYATADASTGKNCTEGLQCVSQPFEVRKFNGARCIAGASGDACQIFNFANPSPAIRDSCQPGLFCQKYAPANNTCVPKITQTNSCNSTWQCVDGLQCYNRTCIPYQTINQPCNILTTNPLTKLLCEENLQCSRGICIANYTVGLDGYCSQDLDCDSAHCDPILRRCTRRKFCNTNAGCTGTGPDANNYCSCSFGAENMGQCVMNSCGKQAYNLIKCTNPVKYDPYANATFYKDPHRTFYDGAIVYDRDLVEHDSGSSIFSKCSGQWSEWVRCQGMMHKWGAPKLALGDIANYDLWTVSASSTVSTSFMVLIAFVMSAIMYL